MQPTFMSISSVKSKDGVHIRQTLTMRKYRIDNPLAVSQKLEANGWELTHAESDYWSYQKGEWDVLIKTDDHPEYGNNQPTIQFYHTIEKVVG